MVNDQKDEIPIPNIPSPQRLLFAEDRKTGLQSSLRTRDKAIPERFPRHYCDFHELIRKGVANSAVERLELLWRVAQHKSLFFKSSWAKYGEAVKGTLKIHPPNERISALSEDYARMQEIFFGQPPDFAAMMTTLRKWEAEFNRP